MGAERTLRLPAPSPAVAVAAEGIRVSGSVLAQDEGLDEKGVQGLPGRSERTDLALQAAAAIAASDPNVVGIPSTAPSATLPPPPRRCRPSHPTPHKSRRILLLG